ncbi:MAG: sigma-70 family RNA polymerase sigma factor [Flavobacteriales bacterium]|nr:sigma-70 family RNA polymerase sigma factor [Flavobacteriales bacterium]
MEAKVNQAHSALIEKCRDGDINAHYELYQLYSKAMYNVSTRIMSNHEDAQDVLQDAFLDAFKSLNKFRGDSSFGSWLKRIVVNKSINALKKKNKNGEVRFDDFHVSVVESNGVHSEEELDYQPEMIQTAINRLPEGCRVVFTLYYLEGYKHKEIAKTLNVSVSTSKSQLNRAKKLLQKTLKTQLI